jgi:GntR family transcriptional regulator
MAAVNPASTVSPALDAICDLTLRPLDRDRPALLHEQVAYEIRRAIANGEAKPGERIPKAKDLAAVLGVNTNTVLRALRTLQAEGLLELRRRRGITVAGTPDRSALIQQIRDLVRTAQELGYDVDGLTQLVIEVSRGRA